MKPAKRVSATVTVFVAAPLQLAFDVFTDEIDSWWRHGPRYRSGKSDSSTMVLEARLGGRLIEKYGDESFALGTVVAWEPPHRLELEWRFRNGNPDETTEVEVTFEAVEGGTQVTVQHRGLHDLRPDHPALHGKQGAALSGMFGSFWSDLARTMQSIVAARARAANSGHPSDAPSK
jgi:uncharacterized protein YndB with AHSA1/START domain